jgi:tricorn protease
MNQRLVLIAAGLLALVPAGCLAQERASTAATAQAAGTPMPVAAATPVGFPQFPSLSPDGSLIVFAWVGDLWAVPVAGGTATRLTSHPADDRRSAFSPDGKTLAFDSDREGGRNLFIMPLDRGGGGSGPGGSIATGGIQRVTMSDRAATLTGWTPDGKSLTFAATLEPAIYRSTRMYAAPIDGSAPRRLSDAYGSWPRLSPDGSTLYFNRGRVDFTRPKYHGSGAPTIWKQDLKAGTFTEVTLDKHLNADAWPLPDGSVIFVSSRDGNNNVFRLPAGATDDRNAVQLTRFAPKAGEVTIAHGVRDLAVSADGKTAVFVYWDSLYTLDLTRSGAEPKPVRVTASADASELDFQRTNLAREVSEQALSPDGKTLAVIARGEVFIRSTDEGRPTRRVTNTSGRETGLAWSPDNRVLFFASDEGGTSQLYYATVALAREDLSPAEAKKDEEKKDDAKAAEKPAAKDGEAKGEGDAKGEAAGEGEKKPAGPKPKKVDHAKRWAEAIRFEVKPLAIEGLAPGRDDGVLGPEFRDPVPSPDGTKLLFTRGLGDLILVDLPTRQARVVFTGWNEPEVQWAGDSRHIVFARDDEDFNSDVYLLDTGESGATPINLTMHPDLDSSPRLSADGKVLYFLSERDGENFQFNVYAVMLDRSLEGLRPYELEEYFKKAAENAKKRKPIDAVMWDAPPTPPTPATPAPAAAAAEPAKAEGEAKAEEGAKGKPAAAKKAPEPMKFDTQDAHLRVRRITSIGSGVNQLQISPGGERIVFSGPGDAGSTEPALVSVSYKNDDRKVIQAGQTVNVRVSLDGSRVTFIRQGQVSSAPIGGGKTDALAIDAPVVIDVAAQQRQKFNEASRIIGNGFYSLKGLDWPKIVATYAPLAARTRTNDEFNRVYNMVLGEFDGSHMGISGPFARDPVRLDAGYLGIDVEPVANGLRVTRVIEGSPAAKPPARLEAGDVLTAIDGQALTAPSNNLSAALMGKSGREVLLEVARANPGPERPGQFLVAPIGSGEDTDLRYAQEVRDRRAMVERLSGGKLGYLHIRGMSEPSVRDFERDLFAAAHGKVALLIDVRDNGGGSTADILLASLTAPRHSYTFTRGMDMSKLRKDAYPRDRRLIYGYNRPISVLINENAFSNAEIFAHAIKTIGRGTLVGTATYGGVISTGAATLIDGTTLRTPFRGWLLAKDDADMENNGARPDLDVPMSPADEAAGRDPQLEAAVKELLSRAGQ